MPAIAPRHLFEPSWIDEAIGWRRHLHSVPELLFDLPLTAAFVADRLRSFGMDRVETGIGGSGVVAVLRGTQGGGTTLGFRADMDALPITEQTGLPYASHHSGRMHACGHDGHTAMLLLAARRLAAHRDFPGTIVFIFQPAEENGGAGARAMVQDGLMDHFGIAEVYGLHNLPGHPLGAFATRPHGIMAAADDLTIRIIGTGGHAARPETCVDPLLVASHIHLALQTIVARNLDPLAAAVISITMMEASDNPDSIAGQATMAGTVRTLDEATRDLCEARIRTIAVGLAALHGASAEVTYLRDYPVTINDPACATRAAVAAARIGPVDPDIRPLMVSEDFSFMLQARPGAFVFLGQGPGPGLHNPAYDFNDAVLPMGAALWIALAQG